MSKKVNITGGDNLSKFIKKLKKQSGNLEVGFFQADQAKKAVTNEFGEEENNIPPRPFMQNAINKNSQEWQYKFTDLMHKDDYNVKKTFQKLGAFIQSDIYDSIEDNIYVPNALYTILKKGFDKPLTDTGIMKQTLTYEVN